MTKKAKERKDTPVFSGVLNYFPDAIKEVAKVSFTGNEQHNPGSKLHWDRSKSGDEKDALTRHLLDAGTIDEDGMRHSAKVAWRALAMLQKEIEAETQENWEEDMIARSKENNQMYPTAYPPIGLDISDYPESNGPCSGHALYSDELEDRMNIVGRNGNDGLHYGVDDEDGKGFIKYPNINIKINE